MAQTKISASELSLTVVRLEKNRRFKAVEDLLHNLLDQSPSHLDASLQLGVFYRKYKKLPQAKLVYSRALSWHPHDAALLSNYGNVLSDLKEYEEAEQLLKKSLEIKPSPATTRNLALHYFHRGMPTQALALFNQLITENTNDADAHWHKALCLLHLKQFKEGWAEYEWRLKLHSHLYEVPKKALWQGEDLQGKSITLFSEQGLGDTLQFTRFINRLIKQGAKVILRVQEPLVPLLRHMRDVHVTSVLEPSIDTDYVLPLLSLPSVLKLETDNDLRLHGFRLGFQHEEANYRIPETSNRKIGLIWAGKKTPKDRSCALENLSFLVENPNIDLFSFQFDSRKKDLTQLGFDRYITDLSPHIGDFLQTALLMQQMDVIISVDTSAAHLAGILGIETKLLLLHYSDWRWFEGASSPWYPEMTLIRQAKPNCWQAAIEQLKISL